MSARMTFQTTKPYIVVEIEQGRFHTAELVWRVTVLKRQSERCQTIMYRSLAPTRSSALIKAESFCESVGCETLLPDETAPWDTPSETCDARFGGGASLT